MRLPSFFRWQPSARVIRSLRILAFVSGAAAIFWICTYKIMDRDFWWHIKAGEILLDTHAMITTDPFAYARAGLPYLATHEWLAQIVLYLVYHLSGATGTILFRGVIACTSVGLLLMLARQWRIAYAALAVWAVVIMKGSFLERPQLFTFVFFCAFVLLAFRFLDAVAPRIRMRICAAFVVLEVLWVNMHGGAALLGCAIVTFLVLQALVNAMRRTGYARDALLPAGTLVLMAVALVLPPNGFATIDYLSQLMSDQTIVFIAEWQPRGWSAYLLDLWPFILLSVAALGSGRKHMVFNGLLLLATAYLSRQAIRHEVIFVFASIGTVFYQLDRSTFPARAAVWINRHRFVFVATAIAVFIIAVHTAAGRSFEFERRDNLFGFGQFDLARGATDFIASENIGGTMFNTYGIGGYLIYRGYPDRKVFIDGRNVDYGFDYMARAYAAGVDASRWKELEDTYNFTYAIVDYDAIQREKDLPYSTILDKDKQWPLVYLDDWVAVYLKDIPFNRPLIDRLQYKFVSPTTLQFDSGFDLVPAADLPTVIHELTRIRDGNPQGVKATLALAKIALRQGHEEDVVALTSDVMRIRPSMPEPYAILATMYVNKGQWNPAADAYRTLLRLAGNSYPNINYGFIVSVFDKAGYTWSARRYRPAGSPPPKPQTASGSVAPSLAVNPAQDSVSFNDRGIAEAENGRFTDAEESFRTAIKLNPSNGTAWSNLCALYMNMSKIIDAEDACNRAIGIDPEAADAHYNLALVYYQSDSMKNAEKEALLAKKFGRPAEADNLLLLIRKKKP